MFNIFKSQEVQVINTKFGDYVKAPGLLRNHYFVLTQYDTEENLWNNTLEIFSDELPTFNYKVLSSKEYPEYYLYEVSIRSSAAAIIEKVIDKYLYRMAVIDAGYANYSKKFWSQIFEKADEILAASRQ